MLATTCGGKSRARGGAAGNRPGSLGCSASALHPAGVLTETTAELAAALTLAAARRVVEADRFMRGGHYKGWLPDLFVGSLLQARLLSRSWSPARPRWPCWEHRRRTVHHLPGISTRKRACLAHHSLVRFLLLLTHRGGVMFSTAKVHVILHARRD